MPIAEEIMTATVITVTPDTPIDIAMDILIENKISGLPVVDETGHMVGILSEADRLKMLRNPEAGNFQQVCQIMTRNVVSVTADTPLHEVVDLLMGGAMRRVPVMKEGCVVGIISRRDLVKQVYGQFS